jgi:phosphoribosylaminoimidazole carboxylase (NCAIR synthetase)
VVFESGWGDEAALRELARQAPTVTLENEFVDAMVLERLQALGCQVRPSPGCVGVVQDKLRQ